MATMMIRLTHCHTPQFYPNRSKVRVSSRWPLAHRDVQLRVSDDVTALWTVVQLVAEVHLRRAATADPVARLHVDVVPPAAAELGPLTRHGRRVRVARLATPIACVPPREVVVATARALPIARFEVLVGWVETRVFGGMSVI